MRFTTFLLSFIIPQKLEVVESAVNGKILVTKFFGQNRIEAGGLTQSGEYVEDLLGKAIKNIKSEDIHDIFVLGLGGGSIIRRMNKHFPKASIIAVELDPVMVELGKKYLHMSDAKNIDVVIDDAIVYVKRLIDDKGKNWHFDLILVDIYIGYEFPKEAQSEDFLKNLKKLIEPGGTVVINRLYFKQYKALTEEFVTRLKDIFSSVTVKKVYSNLLIFAR